MFRKRKCEPDWELIDILNCELDLHNAELWKAAAEIERLRTELQLAHSQIAILASAKIEEEPF